MSAGLLDLQATLAEAILAGGAADASAFDGLVAGGALSADERLAIYAHAYRARLAEALADGHDRTRRWLGEDRFEALAWDYIETHPSRHASLRWYGADLQDWLAAQRPDEPHLAELARLDWALRAAFDAEDAVPLGAADLAQLAPAQWDAIGFHLHPSVQILELAYNAVALWQAVGAAPCADQPTDQPAGSPLARPQPQRLPAAVPVLVWRREPLPAADTPPATPPATEPEALPSAAAVRMPGGQPHFRSLSAAEADALRMLQAGRRFNDVCAEVCASPDAAADAAAQVGGWLRRWLDDGLLVGWHEPPDADA